MKIVVSFKVVHDDQDIQVAGDGSLDFSKAHQVVSTYDLNAIEAAAQLAGATGASLVAISAGGAAIDDSKLRKNVLARGVDELFMTADDACADMDAFASAEALAALLEKVGDYDLVVCGDGSADNYAQQVDIQLAARLGLPVVTAVTKLALEGGVLEAQRTLEDVVETVRVATPAVVSVTPDAALPRIPGMKDIVSAGKKPAEVAGAGVVPTGTLEVLDCRAPQQADRARVIIDAAEEGALPRFAAALKAAL
ncbi:MAG: electron transfer flavoprotein [Eggerthellaceae bacterium]|nr:electron transfer flavoprotein [Eggerthellaceae bacterium]